MVKKVLVALSLLVALLVGSTNGAYAAPGGKVQLPVDLKMEKITPYPDLQYGDYTVQWNRSNDPGVLGYKLSFYGQTFTIKQPSSWTKTIKYTFKHRNLDPNYRINLSVYKKNGISAQDTVMRRIVHPFIFKQPSPPKGLTITNGNYRNYGNRNIMVEWKKNNDSAIGYRVFLNNRPIAIVEQPSRGNTVKVYLPSLKPGTNTVYVTAYNTVYRESAPSNKGTIVFRH